MNPETPSLQCYHQERDMPTTLHTSIGTLQADTSRSPPSKIRTITAVFRPRVRRQSFQVSSSSVLALLMCLLQSLPPPEEEHKRKGDANNKKALHYPIIIARAFSAAQRAVVEILASIVFLVILPVILQKVVDPFRE